MSGQIYSIKTWEKFEYHVGGPKGPVITCELKRMNPFEAAPFKRALFRARAAFWAAMPKDEAEPDVAANIKKVAAMETSIRNVAMARIAYFEQFSEEAMAQVFDRCVRNIEVFIDGENVTDAKRLIQIGDADLLLEMINKLEHLCHLTVEEGKGSASPSISASEVEPSLASLDSLAPSTDGEASPTVSTVTETPNANESSSDLVSVQTGGLA